MRIYLASSWRNGQQQKILHALRDAGHEVYDFRNPAPGESGYQWTEIDPDWQRWSPRAFRDALKHPIAEHGFNRDMDALRSCDACVLLLPCGRSAHLEAGWAAGNGKPLGVLLADGEPELMLKMADAHCVSMDELLTWLRIKEASL